MLIFIQLVSLNILFLSHSKTNTPQSGVTFVGLNILLVCHSLSWASTCWGLSRGSQHFSFHICWIAFTHLERSLWGNIAHKCHHKLLCKNMSQHLWCQIQKSLIVCVWSKKKQQKTRWPSDAEQQGEGLAIFMLLMGLDCIFFSCPC